MFIYRVTYKMRDGSVDSAVMAAPSKDELAAKITSYLSGITIRSIEIL
jgi:hypothetical protein